MSCDYQSQQSSSLWFLSVSQSRHHVRHLTWQPSVATLAAASGTPVVQTNGSENNSHTASTNYFFTIPQAINTLY